MVSSTLLAVTFCASVVGTLAGWESSDIKSEVREFAFLRDKKLDSVNLNHQKKACFRSIELAQIVTKDVLEKGYNQGLGCQDVKNLCKACSGCDEFTTASGSVSTAKNCLCLASDDLATPTVSNFGDCLIIPFGSVYTQDLNLGTGDDCFIATTGPSSQVNGGAGEDTFLVLGNAVLDPTQLLGIDAGADDDCVYLANHFEQTIDGSAGDDIIFFDSTREASVITNLVWTQKVYGGLGDDIIVANNRAYFNPIAIAGVGNAFNVYGDDGNDIIRFSGYGNLVLGGLGDDDIDITGDGYVYYVFGGAGYDTIHLHHGASVRQIDGGEDDDLVYNSGTVEQYVYLGEGDDYFINEKNGHIKGYPAMWGAVLGENGNDVIVNEGYIYDIFGGQGNDNITNNGIVGDDINGEAGSDIIDVGKKGFVFGAIDVGEAGDAGAPGVNDLVLISGKVLDVYASNPAGTEDRIVVTTDGRVVDTVYGFNHVEIDGSVGHVEGYAGAPVSVSVSTNGRLAGIYLEATADINIKGKVNNVYLEGNHPDNVKVQNGAKVDYIVAGGGADNVEVESGASILRVYADAADTCIVPVGVDVDLCGNVKFGSRSN